MSNDDSKLIHSRKCLSLHLFKGKNESRDPDHQRAQSSNQINVSSKKTYDLRSPCWHRSSAIHKAAATSSPIEARKKCQKAGSEKLQPMVKLTIAQRQTRQPVEMRRSPCSILLLEKNWLAIPTSMTPRVVGYGAEGAAIPKNSTRRRQWNKISNQALCERCLRTPQPHHAVWTLCST